MAATAGNKGGTWIALLATSTTPGLSRVTASGPWFQELSNGTFVRTYNNVANLQTSALASIDTDEQGQTISTQSSRAFWSGMTQDGMTADTCNDWTSDTATGRLGNGTVLGSLSTGCNQSLRLLCIEE
jgi:hypothetical protein